METLPSNGGHNGCCLISERNGIKCEMKVFDEYSYLHNLDAGWFYSPEECYEEKPKIFHGRTEKDASIEATQAPKEKIQDRIARGILPDEEIRLFAKEMNIKGYHNKSIGRLKKEIKGSAIKPN